jgi:hypothetical protein
MEKVFFEISVLNNNWKKRYFALTTEDLSNDYYQSGCLPDMKFY